MDEQNNQNCESRENHSETGEEIIDLVTNHGPDFTPHKRDENQSDDDDDEARVTAAHP